MKKYDYVKAKQLIEAQKENIAEASLGMYEDWFWTAETVFEHGNSTKDLTEGTTIGGINGSLWATPTIQFQYKDGSSEMIPCYIGESTSYQPPFPNLGVLSGPVQDSLPPLTFKYSEPTEPA